MKPYETFDEMPWVAKSRQEGSWRGDVIQHTLKGVKDLDGQGPRVDSIRLGKGVLEKRVTLINYFRFGAEI